MKTVLITGASRGIGAAVAEKFAENGYFVIINYNKSREKAEALAEKLGGFAIRADVGSPDETEKMLDEILSRFGGVDILVNNAGISHFSLFTDIDEDAWQRVMNVNLSGVYRVTRGVLPYMISKKSGSIVNVSSIWGEVGASCEAAYSAAKAGVIGLTKALAKELGPSGIRVNCVAPGVIDTDMNSCLDKAALDELKDETPLMRIGKPSEVADAVYFLANAEFVTGRILGVNGGFVI